jgi:hypothetical protein
LGLGPAQPESPQDSPPANRIALIAAIEEKTRNKGKLETVLLLMAGPPGSPSALAKTVATAGALTAAAGVALFSWRGIEITHALAALAVGSSALLLHVRRTGAQLAARSLWIASGILATLNLILGPWSQSVLSATVMAGSGAALFALGRSGLGPETERGPFAPSKYRAPLLVALGLAIADALGFAFYGSVLLEAWGLWTSNLIFAAALGAGAWGLSRMRTWGLLALGATHAAIVAVALAGSLRLPLVVQGIYGISSAIALAALAPLLALAGKRLLSSEAETTGYRIAVPQAAVAAAQPVDPDLAAEADVAAAADAEPLPARRYRVG